MDEISKGQTTMLSIIENLRKFKDTDIRNNSALLQRSVFLLKSKEDLELDYDFECSPYGPFSEKIVVDLDTLEKKRYIRAAKGDIVLTRKGKKVIKENPDKKCFEIVVKFVRDRPNKVSILKEVFSSPEIVSCKFGEPIKFLKDR
jgi:uncharacterized protein YwgA